MHRGINHMTPEKTTRRKKNPSPVLVAECVDCHKDFEVSTDGSTSSMFESKWFQFPDGLYKLSSFDCPYCGRRHIVQVDTEFTERKLKKIAKIIASGRKSGVKQMQRDLDRARKIAAGNVSGCNFFDPDTGLNYDVELVTEEECNVRRVG